MQRAFKTADAIRTAQPIGPSEELEVKALEVLREQNFGFYEGKPFYARKEGSKQSGKDEHKLKHQDEPDFKDVESKEAMADRMDQFLQQHLILLLTRASQGKGATVAIVSHGIILSHLWRCFLKLFPKSSVTLSPGLLVGTGGFTPLEHLGGWSNTGCLELDVSACEDQLDPSLATKETATEADKSDLVLLPNHRMTIMVVNGKEHLVGLKRTKGVGSSQYDEGQKKIETFFKKRKL